MTLNLHEPRWGHMQQREVCNCCGKSWPCPDEGRVEPCPCVCHVPTKGPCTCDCPDRTIEVEGRETSTQAPDVSTVSDTTSGRGLSSMEPYSIPWKNHRQRLVVEGVEVNEATCAKCGQEWPCDVAQAFDAGYERGLEQNDDA